jgi:phage FluMu protein Com
MKVYNIEDYREVWDTKNMRCNFCGKEWQAVFHKECKELECPICEMMVFIVSGDDHAIKN